MSKMTAVQWLEIELSELECTKNERSLSVHLDLIYETFQEALQMEREQIQDAFYHGVDIDAFNVNNKWTEAEKYYEQTHGGQDEK